MKKKIFTLALALMLVMSMSVPALAADVTAPGSSNTTMTYNVASTYTVVIPETITIDTVSKTGSIALSVNAGALIANGTSINVKLQTCDFTLTNSDDNITYTINSNVAQGDTVLTHAAGTTTATTANLTLNVTQNPKYSGDYTDSITFAVSVDTDVS